MNASWCWVWSRATTLRIFSNELSALAPLLLLLHHRDTSALAMALCTCHFQSVLTVSPDDVTIKTMGSLYIITSLKQMTLNLSEWLPNGRCSFVDWMQKAMLLNRDGQLGTNHVSQFLFFFFFAEWQYSIFLDIFGQCNFGSAQIWFSPILVPSKALFSLR